MVMMVGGNRLLRVVEAYYWWKKKWKIKRFPKTYDSSVAFPQIANIAGGISSCIGRQP